MVHGTDSPEQLSEIMPRILKLDDKFLYTKTDPTNIISAKKGALFFRRGKKFFLNPDGNSDSTWIPLPYRTVVYPVPSLNKPLFFEHQNEIWEKNSNGFYDEFKELLPKTDWKFYSYDDAFISIAPKTIRWIFPVPTSSSDPIGNDNDRSYDTNFFYAKVSGQWLRTPISIYESASVDSGENAFWYNNLPFVDYPRKLPVPNPSDAGIDGEQSYDRDFFYVKVTVWKRTPLNYFYLSKMTIF